MVSLLPGESAEPVAVMFLFLFCCSYRWVLGSAAAPHLCCCRAPDPTRRPGELAVRSTQPLIQIAVPSTGVLQTKLKKYSAFGDDEAEPRVWLVPPL